MAKANREPEQVDDILADFLGRPQSTKTKAPVASPEAVFGDEELPPDSMPAPSQSARIPRKAQRPNTARTDVQSMIERELDSVHEEDLDAQYEAEGELDARAQLASVHPRSVDGQTTDRSSPNPRADDHTTERLERARPRPRGFDEATVVGRRPRLEGGPQYRLYIVAGILTGGVVVLIVGLWLVLSSTQRESVPSRATRPGVSDHEGTDGPRPRVPAKPKTPTRR